MKSCYGKGRELGVIDDYKKATNEPEGRCSSCRFYEPFSGNCWNGVSDHYQRYMPPYEVCDEYTVIEEDEEP